MKSTYQIGRANEIEVRKRMEDEGWVCWRPPTSKFGEQDIFGLWDIICHNKEEIRFIQVKTGGIQGGRLNLIKKLGDFFKGKRKIKISKQLWHKKTTKKEGEHYEVTNL